MQNIGGTFKYNADQCTKTTIINIGFIDLTSIKPGNVEVL